MAGYEEKIATLNDLDVEVIAASVDGREEAAGTVERLSLSYPVLYGLDARAVAERFGLWTHEKGYLQPAGFLLRGDEIHLMSYASGAIGRLEAEDVALWVDHVESQH